MYRVVNQLTWQEFSVKTKDELYQELELLNARKNALDTRDEYQVSSITEDGEIVDERIISIPFPADQTVDELLFGFDEKKGKSLFSNLVSLIRKPQAKPTQEEPISQSDDGVVVEEEPPTPEEPLEQAIPPREEVEDSPTQPIQEDNEDSLATHVEPKEPSPVAIEQTEEEETIPPAPASPEPVAPKAAPPQPEPTQASVSPKETFRAQQFEVDVRETSQVLMQSFLTTIDHEVEEIDGLIERLRRERENRLRMRQALIDTTLL